VGPSGAGKTLLARCLPGLLPALTAEEAHEVAKTYSQAGTAAPAGRPLCCPPPGLTVAGLLGARRSRRPGMAMLACYGVLLLEDLTALPWTTQEALCRLLDEHDERTVAGRFLLAATVLPCPCGHRTDDPTECRCPADAVARFRARVGGPLLDRIDLHVEVPPVSLRELRSAAPESSAAVAARVAAVHRLQARRPCCTLDAAGCRLLAAAFEKLALSARALDHIPKVARTIADLGGSEEIRSAHLAEAIQYRCLERRVAG
jgi:magnesium chelatase family protein